MDENSPLPAMAGRAVSAWVGAMRPRTLPLALASILTGGFLAVAGGTYRWQTILFAVLTGILLQILSNLANDYGDAVKGADNERRAGPMRAVQSGRIRAAAMKKGIILFSVICLLSGGILLYVASGDSLLVSVVFVLLGIGAVVAAIAYTIGSKAYGYKGLGDLFVFVFFGLVGVAGTWFLNTDHWRWDILLPAAAVGCLSTGVLNLNNMRDMDNDRASGKRTLALLFGYSGARAYHCLLIFFAFALTTAFAVVRYRSPWNLSFLATLPLFVRDLVTIAGIREKRRLDPFLRRLALSSLLFSVLFGAGQIV